MNGQPGGDIILYRRDDAPAIEVRLDDDTVWLSQQQLADLFQTSRTNVVEHIANIYAEDELPQEATCREFRQVRSEGSRQVTRTLPFYNLPFRGRAASTCGSRAKPTWSQTCAANWKR